MEHRPPPHAQSRHPVRSRQRVRARIVRRGGGSTGQHRVSGDVLSEAAVQRLEHVRAAASRRVGSERRRQDVDQGRLGALRSPAAAGARARFRGRAGEDDGDVPVARSERQPQLRPRRGELEHERPGFLVAVRRFEYGADWERAGAEERRAFIVAGTRAAPELRPARERHLLAISQRLSHREPASPVQHLQHPRDEYRSGS